jgi:hypothetical protein
MAQADPSSDAMFVMQLKSGDQPAVYKWWIDNPTILKVGN